MCKKLILLFCLLPFALQAQKTIPDPTTTAEAIAGVVGNGKYITAEGLNAALTNGGLRVILTNGAYELQSDFPLSIPDGLLLGGTNGAGTYGITKTNWSRTITALQLVNVGPGPAFDLVNTNAVGFFGPGFSDAMDKSTNFANYVIYIPPDCDTTIAPKLLITAVKTGTAGNAVLSFQFTAGGNPVSFPGSPATEFLATNAFSGAGTRASSYEITPAWTLTADATTVIQVARDGDDTADTLVGNLTIRGIWLKYQQK